MGKLNVMFKKNWSTIILVGMFIILLVSPDAKAWVMRQMLSTGLFNSKIEEKRTESHQSEVPAAVSESFTIKDEQGRTINTAELKGKVVFINFWASWCPPCRAEFPSIQKLYNKYQSNPGIVFLTVNLDDEAKAGKTYLKKENFTIPFMVAEGPIPAQYFNGALPTTVILDKTGAIRLYHTGIADYSKTSFYEQINSLLNE